MSSNTNWKKISNNPNNKAIMINYNKYKILNLIDIIHKKRILIHIKKFMIWMI
jgi:hypothetical protein